MRVLLVITLLLLRVGGAVAEEPEDAATTAAAESIAWMKAFSPISSVDADGTLVFMVITNDDPTISHQPTGDPAERIDANLWCAGVLARSLRRAFDIRQDLRSRAVVQSLPVGMPAALTGGSLRNQPARAILAVCDGNYRLLGFTIGVPDTDGLLTLIEDAEQVRLLLQTHGRAREEIIAAVAARSSDRLSRTWRAALEAMIEVMGDGQFDDDADVPSALAQRQAGRLTRLSEAYEPHYLADVKLRFGLTETADRTRLVILEQHPEARRPWTDAAMAFLAGEDFLTLWRPLCESLWGFHPIMMEFKDPELLRWWDSLSETDAVVFSLQPPLLVRRQPWPPIAGDGKTGRRGLGWKDVQEMVVQLSYRTIDAQQLFTLMHSRHLMPVDIQFPRTARYLYFPAGNKTAVVVREGDPPGRFVGRLKRAQ